MKRITRLTKSPRFACLVLMAVHAALSMVYVFTTPVWESYDETGHYAYARYLALNGGRFPSTGMKLDRYDESHQPPLYYWLVGLALSGIDTSDDVQPAFNPPWWRIWIVPDPRLTDRPWAGTALAVRVGRLVSVCLSTLAVGCTFVTAQALLPKKPAAALLATGLHAVWPLFLFIGGAITNDVGIALFGSLVLLFCARLWVRRASALSRADLLLFAVCVAGATLTKDSAIALVVFALLVVAWLAVQQASRRRWTKVADIGLYFFVPLAIFVVIGIGLSGGRSLRQFVSTGGMVAGMGAAAMPGIGHSDASSGSGGSLISSFLKTVETYGGRFMFDSFFGAFGWGAIRMPPEWYLVARMAAVLSAIGLLASGRRRETRNVIGFLITGLGCVVAAPAARTALAGEAGLLMGRFYLPGLGALCLLLSIGLFALSDRLLGRAGRVLPLGVLAGAGLVGVMTPSVVIAPAVAKPPFVLSPYEDMRDIQVAENIVYGDSIRLLGYSLSSTPATRANGVTVVLFWRGVRRMDTDYRLRLELFAQDGRSLQILEEFDPGFGQFSTRQWAPGDTFAEYYHLPVWPHTPTPILAQVRAHWVNRETSISLAPACEGRPCDGRFGQVPIRADESELQQWIQKPSLFQVGDQIDLLDVTSPASIVVGEPLTVTVFWRGRGENPAAQTVFIHVLDSNGALVAQSDSQPVNGGYPTTAWSIDEVVPDTHVLDTRALGPGRYTLALGMYDSQTQIRQSVTDVDGRPVAEGVIVVGSIDVREGQEP